MSKVFFAITSSASVKNVNDPNTGGSKSLEFLGPYGPSRFEWNFPLEVPEGKIAHITDLEFQSKCVRYPNQNGSWRNSYCILDSITTLAENFPVRHYVTPIRLPPGFIITGKFQNNSPEDQNMIVRVHGYLEDDTQ